MIFWFFGFHGTGKDYCAKILTKLKKASYIHIDDVLTNQDREKLINGTFNVEDRINKLERATKKIDVLLKTNTTVVAADSLPDHRSRDFLLEKFKDNIVFIRVKVYPEIHKKRFAERKNHFFTEDLLNDWVEKHWQEPIKIPHLILNNNTEGEKSVGHKLKKIL